MLCLAGSILLLFLLTKKSSSFSKKRFIYSPILYLIIVSLVVFQSVSWRIASSSSILIHDIHFDAVFYSVSQAAAGKTLLADLPAQYGLYAELIKPIYNILNLNLSLLSFSCLMAILQIAGLLASISCIFLILHSRLLATICSITLVFITGGFFLYISTDYLDPYYQYWPIRFFFPALSVFLFYQSLKHPSIPKNTGLYILASVATLWNFDTGIPVLGALVSFTILKTIFSPQWDKKKFYINSLITGMTFYFTLIGMFLVYLAFKANNQIDFDAIIKYQKIFYGSGFFMLPMPLTAHAWMVVIGIYMTGITSALFYWLKGRHYILQSILFYTSVLGIGLFSYYQGRSHDLVLTAVLWPAVVIIFILVDRLLGFVKAGLAPQQLALAAIPVLLVGFLSTGTILIRLPYLVSNAMVIWRSISDQNYITSHLLTGYSKTAILQDGINFIKKYVKPGESAVIISDYYSVYYAETGLATVGGPGLIEMLLKSDLDNLIKRLRNKPVPHLFLKQRQLPGGIYSIIRSQYGSFLNQYRLVDAGFGLAYLVPKTGQFNSPDNIILNNKMLADDKNVIFHRGIQDFLVSDVFDLAGFNDEFSIEIIVKPYLPQLPYATIMGTYPGTENFHGFVLESKNNQGDYSYEIGSGSQWEDAGTFNIDVGKWNYIAINKFKNEITIFKNGVLKTRKIAEAYKNSDMPLVIGNWYFQNRPFNGIISEVKISSKALAPQEIIASWDVVGKIISQ